MSGKANPTMRDGQITKEYDSDLSRSAKALKPLELNPQSTFDEKHISLKVQQVLKYCLSTRITEGNHENRQISSYSSRYQSS